MAVSVAELVGSIELDDDFSSALGGVTVGITAAIAAVGALSAAIVALGMRGSDVGDITEAFDMMNQQIGNTGDVIGGLREAFDGTVTDFTIMEATNKALNMGLKITAEEMALTATAARVLGEKTGVDAVEAYERMNAAMATGQTRMVKGLLDTVALSEAVDKYAASLGKSTSELSAHERQLATQTAILQAAKTATENFGEVQLDFTDRIKIGQTAIANFTDRLAVTVATTPALNAIIDQLNGFLEQLIAWLDQNRQAVQDWITMGIFFAINVLDSFITIIGYVGDVIDFVIITFHDARAAAISFAMSILELNLKLAQMAKSAPGGSTLAKMFGGVDVDKQIKSTSEALDSLEKSYNSAAQAAQDQMNQNIEWNETMEAGHQVLNGVTKAVADSAGQTIKYGGAVKTAADRTKDADDNTKDFAESLKRVNEQVKAFTGAKAAQDMDELARAVAAAGDAGGVMFDQWDEIVEQVEAARNAGVPIREDLSQQADSWRTILAHVDSFKVRLQKAQEEGVLVTAEGMEVVADTTEEAEKKAQELADELANVAMEMELAATRAARLADTMDETADILNVGAGMFQDMAAGLERAFGKNALSTLMRFNAGLMETTGTMLRTGAAFASGDIAGTIQGGMQMLGNMAQSTQQAGAGNRFLGGLQSGMGIVPAGLSAIFGGGEAQRVVDMRDRLIEAQGGMRAFAEEAARAGTTLEGLFNAQTVDEYNAALADLDAAINPQEQAWARVQEAVDRYGFTLDELGDKMQMEQFEAQAGQLIEDFALLTASGIEQATVLERMAPAMNEYLQSAMAAGQEIPEAMRPALQGMVDMGLLTDEAGNKMTSLDDVDFATSISDGIERIVAGIDRMVNAMNGIPNIERSITIKKLIDDNTGMAVPGFAEGGIATSPTFGVFGEAGPEALIPLDRLGSLGNDNEIVALLRAILTEQQGTRQEQKNLPRALRDAQIRANA